MPAVFIALLMLGSCTAGAGRFAPGVPAKTTVTVKRERHTLSAGPNLDVTSPTASLKATLRR